MGSCRQYTIVPFPITDNTQSQQTPTTNAEKIKEDLGLEGSGTTESDPLIITDANQLSKLGEYDTEGVYFEIKSDINLSKLSTITLAARSGEDIGTTNWTPIGTLENPFKGTIAGAGSGITISGLVINETGTSAYGLFGYTDGATISGITVQGNINAPSSDMAALLVGQAANGTVISNCVSGSADNNTANQSTVSAGEAAGLVGKMIGSGTIENSKNYATVTATGIESNFKAGGIVQSSYYPIDGEEYPLEINSCENYGDVNGGNHSGGVVGLATGTMVYDSDNYGKVTGSYYIGGIVGSLKVGSAVETATNEGNIVVTDKRSNFYGIGGIVGVIESRDVPFVASVSEVTNKGSISVEDDVSVPVTMIGGIVGTINNNAAVSGDNEAVINIPSAEIVGGLVGKATGYAAGSEARVTISGTNSSTGAITAAARVGGLVGETSGPVTISGKNEAPVKVQYTKADLFAGGIVGRMMGDGQRISSVENAGNLSVDNTAANEVESPRRLGGIVGYIESSDAIIDGAVNTGNIEAENISRVGGVIGETSNSGDSPDNLVIKNVSVKSSTIKGLNQVGGIVGYFNGGSITGNAASDSTGYMVDSIKIASEAIAGGAIGASYGTGTVSGVSINEVEIEVVAGDSTSRNRYTGGFVGQTYSNASYSYSSCFVSAGKISSSITTEIKHIGGFVGSAYTGTYNSCEVNGFEFASENYGNACGGFVGYATDDIGGFNNCKSAGITATDSSVMGFVGSGSTDDTSKYAGSNYEQGSSSVTESGIPTA